MNPERNSYKSQLHRVLGVWDVLLFNIAAVLGPRWIASAAHSGPSSISLWFLAAGIFFLPTAFIIAELSTRFPLEGGLYVWCKEAFGDFHGFVAGWSYWVYTLFYFPGLLTASVAMSVYIGGAKYGYLAANPRYLLVASMAMLGISVFLNVIGLNVGKWLQNAGGIGTYVPLLILLSISIYIALHYGSATRFSLQSCLPKWNWGTVNFWSQIAFAFSGMELVCTMSEEIRDPRRTFPRAICVSALLIALIYIVGTVSLLTILPATGVDVRNGVFQAITHGSATLGIAWIGIVAALLVTAGNAGGVGATVAGVARIPFVAGIDRFFPRFFGHIHPRWGTPYISILIQGSISALLLIGAQINASITEAYQFLVDMAVILYFIPLLYMYGAVIKLAYRPDRQPSQHQVLIPGGKTGVCIAGALGFAVTLASMVLAMIPPGDVEKKIWYEVKLVIVVAIVAAVGLTVYYRGVVRRANETQIGTSHVEADEILQSREQ